MKQRLLILGYGEMGHAIQTLLHQNHDVRIWSRSHAATLEDEVATAQVILFCLPAIAHREITSRIVSHLAKNSVCLTMAKGLDESGQTAPQVLTSVLTGRHRYGAIYGPMISEEIRLGRHAFADVAMSDPADFKVVQTMFQGSPLICRASTDMHGCAWAVILKNVYAIIFGVADELQLGDNMRGHLMVAAMSELSALVQSLGGEQQTVYGYAGLGDLLTTATSAGSHHHALGRQLASGQWTDISGEGVHTLQMVEKYRLFDSHAYPLYALVRDVVTFPAALNSRVQSYLDQLRAAQCCIPYRFNPV